MYHKSLLLKASVCVPVAIGTFMALHISGTCYYVSLFVYLHASMHTFLFNFLHRKKLDGMIILLHFLDMSKFIRSLLYIY